MYKIKMAPSAHEDIVEIKEYIARDNGEIAVKFVRKLYDEMRALGEHPHLGISLEAKTGITTKYRYLIYNPYLIFYKVEGDYVNVYRVLHGMRNYLKILDL